ncbi:MAG TPA: sensor histidine kinase N-terminal domain-containing protein [Steroidobacteraceae bacterium]|nr:sensor histidine kinase N-terminal domain-containing protein [Steroidobacteraceae bacterium]
MAESSLRGSLTLRVLFVALLLLALDALACYSLASHFVNLAYDRWLIDDTRSLAQALEVSGGRVRVDLPRVALQIFEFDEVDTTYYRVTTRREGTIMASESQLPPAAGQPAFGDVSLANGTVDGKAVRIVVTRVDMPAANDVATIEVGETLNKRATLAREILLAMAAPQLALIVAALLFVWFAVGHGLRPLTSLAAAIEARGQANLTPVPELDLPHEARVLVSRINDLLARLERAMVAQRRFVADAAHQLRTPLATVLLHTERAERATDEESRNQALRSLHTSVARAARLSHQLLSLARAEPEAAATQALAPLDLGALARSIGEEWIPRALARGIDFGFLAPAQPVIIEGNVGQLDELMSNLIDNAIRYSPPHSAVTLSVSASPPTLHVEDDGPGIPEEDQERVFERFYRGSTSEGEGCGLGLAIVREIAIRHHAIARVKPGRGHGACFEVVFPPVSLRPASSAQQADAGALQA